MRWLIVLAFAFLALLGCGPTRTEGTKGVAKKDLAILTVAQPGTLPRLELESIQFDGEGPIYALDDRRDFYLLPGQHTASFGLRVVVEGPPGWFIPKKALDIPGPRNIPLGLFEVGREYELAGIVEGFEKMVAGGEMTLIREKRK